jgi:hypothetical protein
VSNGATQQELLEGLSKKHRGIVAFSLDLPRWSSAQQIAGRLESEPHLRAVFEGVSGAARKLLAEAVFDRGGVALRVSLAPRDEPFFGHERQTAAIELERRGLAFAFLDGTYVNYHVPVDLRLRLRRLFAARCARRIKSATARSWLPAERRDVSDIVAVWAQLAKVPAPVTYKGELHVRSVPRLLAALPELEFLDPGGTIAGRRLELALAQLRDSGHLRLQMPDEHSWKRYLVAAGDLGETLRTANPFRRFPGRSTGPDHRRAQRYDDAVTYTRALSEALGGRTISLANLGRAIGRLQRTCTTFSCEECRPEMLALLGLLPEWLRGELQLGLTGDEPVAAHFVRSDAVSPGVRELADRYGALSQTAPVDDRSGDPPSGSLWVGDWTHWKWAPRKPEDAESMWNEMCLDGPGIVLFSTLDNPLRADVMRNRLFTAA